MSKQTPKAIRGTQDILGGEAEAFGLVVAAFERVRRLYRFGRAEFPVFEKTEVFARSLGETTDVVSKEMYSFEDRGGESVTLRPEFTAGVEGGRGGGRGGARGQGSLPPHRAFRVLCLIFLVGGRGGSTWTVSRGSPRWSFISIRTAGPR